MLFLILILLSFQHNFAFEARLDGKLFKFDKFMEACKDEPSLMNHTITLRQTSGKKLNFDFDIYLKQTIEKANLMVTFERCSSKETLDTCRVIRTLKSNRACFLINAKLQVWTPVTKCMKTKVQCPVQEGKYYGRNCTFDFSVFNYIPFGRDYWKVKAKGYLETGVIIGCAVVFEGQVIKN